MNLKTKVESTDGRKLKRTKVLDKNDERDGKMWEFYEKWGKT